MPNYGTLTAPAALYPGDSVLAFNGEQPASGTLSERYAIAPGPSGVAPTIDVEVSFAAAPGAFEFDVMEADTDVSTSFIQVPAGGTINAVSANNKARADLSPFTGSFIAISAKTQNANAVNAFVRITRRG